MPGRPAFPSPLGVLGGLAVFLLIRGRREAAASEQPHDTWCVDFKGHFALGDKTRCHPLTLTDQASRYLLKCEGVAKPDDASVRPHFERAFHEFGLPNRIRSNNGPPFATQGIGGLSALSVSWIKLGVIPERIEPGKPQQNGRHERMHKTLKAEATSPPEAMLATQQRVFDSTTTSAPTRRSASGRRHRVTRPRAARCRASPRRRSTRTR
jgi:putative transposase